MNLAEDSVGNLRTPGGAKAYADVLRSQRSAILGTGLGVGPSGKVRKLSDFGYDVKTGTWE